MTVFKKYESAIRWSLRKWIDEIKEVDLLIGIPTYNCEDTVGQVISKVGEGLKTYYPELKTAIVVLDGGSLDDTRENAYEAKIPEGLQRRVAIYRGKPGKGTSLKAVFETAQLLKADACVVVDSDIKNINPKWIKLLADPILKNKADYVTPYYLRHKYDGTITNTLIYPFTRALYGRRIRQPIGGDFGLNADLAASYTNEDVWDTDISGFGIDIWMTTTAINEDWRIVQANLGSKVHVAKDPALDLGSMFREVLGTLFFLMSKYENIWMRVSGSEDVAIVGSPDGGNKLESVPVSHKKLKDEFCEGFSHFAPLYDQVLEAENYVALKELTESIEKGGEMLLPDELWARIVYDFAFTFQAWSRNRRKLIDIMTPLYFGKTAAYCREVADMNSNEINNVVEREAETFERLKPYLIKKFKAWK